MSFSSVAFTVGIPVFSLVNCIKEYDFSEEETFQDSIGTEQKYTLKSFGYSSCAYTAIYQITGIVPTYFSLIAKLNGIPTSGKPFKVLRGTCFVVQCWTMLVELRSLQKISGKQEVQREIDRRVRLIPIKLFFLTTIPTLLITSGYFYTKPVCRAIYQKITRL